MPGGQPRVLLEDPAVTTGRAYPYGAISGEPFLQAPAFIRLSDSLVVNIVYVQFLGYSSGGSFKQFLRH